MICFKEYLISYEIYKFCTKLTQEFLSLNLIFLLGIWNKTNLANKPWNPRNIATLHEPYHTFIILLRYILPN